LTYRLICVDRHWMFLCKNDINAFFSGLLEFHHIHSYGFICPGLRYPLPSHYNGGKGYLRNSKYLKVTYHFVLKCVKYKNKLHSPPLLSHKLYELENLFLYGFLIQGAYIFIYTDKTHSRHNSMMTYYNHFIKQCKLNKTI